MESLQKPLQNFETSNKELCYSIVVVQLGHLNEFIDKDCASMSINAEEAKEKGYALPENPLPHEIRLKKLFTHREKVLTILERVNQNVS